MADLILPRRQFLIGAAATLFVAPAIVRATSIMPVKAMLPSDELVVKVLQYTLHISCTGPNEVTSTWVNSEGIVVDRWKNFEVSDDTSPYRLAP